MDVQLKAMQIPAGARVLDIGGGTGTHAIPLAAGGCNVTVIEPSVVMREELHKNLASSGAGSVTVIPSRWEDVSLSEPGDPFDAVIASYSLSMMDIGEALEKMQVCCRGTVHLFWFLSPPSWARVSRDLWPMIHGREYPVNPSRTVSGRCCMRWEYMPILRPSEKEPLFTGRLMKSFGNITSD